MRYGSNASRSSAVPSLRSGVSAAAIALAIAAMLLVPAAHASDLIGANAQAITLKVHGKRALVEFRERGRARHVLVWGAVDARTPESKLAQVRFQHDYSGGLKLEHRAMWKTWVDE